jgi:hypothetical protein
VSTATHPSAPTLWERRGTALGIPAVVIMAVSFAFAGNGPGSTDGDDRITSWYASGTHQYTQILGFLAFVIGVLCLIGFLAALRDRIAAVEQPRGGLGQLVLGAGIASSVLFTLAIAMFTVPAFLASDTSSADIVPATYRMFYTAGFASFAAATMIGALTVGATSAVAFRTGLLPRWFAWLGVVVAIVLLLGFFFVPGFVFWGWVLIAAILLARRAPAHAHQA